MQSKGVIEEVIESFIFQPLLTSVSTLPGQTGNLEFLSFM